ncbi:MAG TPA: glycosyltransferase family A protein [Thermomicrobiaceae bacterium]|nr:glycosyltransferase family A protein [Thermomicrobiaceae bacterium]
MLPSVTVITITRGRPALLGRAVASVRAQTYAGPVTHRILVDDCPATASMLAEASDSSGVALEWRLVPRGLHDLDGPSRLARLRNQAVRDSASDYVAFLDDDNEIEPDHLDSLVGRARDTGSHAVHSWRRLFLADGAPYLEARLPWKRDRDEGARIYQDLCGRGVFQPGSNVARDRADPKGHPDPTRTVDMGEWLFDRALLLEIPFCEHYSHQDWLDVIPEDYKLLRSLIEHDVRIASTGLPTLRYYLGGYSNAFSPDARPATVWADTRDDDPGAAASTTARSGTPPGHGSITQPITLEIVSDHRTQAA